MPNLKVGLSVELSNIVAKHDLWSDIGIPLLHINHLAHGPGVDPRAQQHYSQRCLKRET